MQGSRLLSNSVTYIRISLSSKFLLKISLLVLMMHSFILELTERYVHMYIACTHVCMYVCMYVCIYVVVLYILVHGLLTQVVKMTKMKLLWMMIHSMVRMYKQVTNYHIRTMKAEKFYGFRGF